MSKVAKITGYYAIDGAKKSVMQDIEVNEDTTVGLLRERVIAKIQELGGSSPIEFELWCRPGTTGPAFAMEDSKTMIGLYPHFHEVDNPFMQFSVWQMKDGHSTYPVDPLTGKMR